MGWLWLSKGFWILVTWLLVSYLGDSPEVHLAKTPSSPLDKSWFKSLRVIWSPTEQNQLISEEAFFCESVANFSFIGWLHLKSLQWCPIQMRAFNSNENGLFCNMATYNVDCYTMVRPCTTFVGSKNVSQKGNHSCCKSVAIQHKYYVGQMLYTYIFIQHFTQSCKVLYNQHQPYNNIFESCM